MAEKPNRRFTGVYPQLITEPVEVDPHGKPVPPVSPALVADDTLLVPLEVVKTRVRELVVRDDELDVAFHSISAQKARLYQMAKKEGFSKQLIKALMRYRRALKRKHGIEEALAEVVQLAGPLASHYVDAVGDE